MICFRCEGNISFDEAALNKKLINRGCTKYLCLDCLSNEFKVSKKALSDKIEYFKKSGCTLFSR